MRGAARPGLRLLHGLRRAVPLSGRGALLAALCGAALWRYGYGELDLVVFVLGLAGLGLVLLCALVCVGAALRLRRHTASRDELALRRLEVGAVAPSGFTLPAWSWLPLLRVEWSWREPSAFRCTALPRAGRLVEEVCAARRCEAGAVRRRFEAGDVFGLARLAWDETAPAAFTVLPDPGRLRHTPLVASLAAADGIPFPGGAPEGDRMEIRRYAPGDSVRDIHWKSYARSRQLNVRRPEQAVDRARRFVAYLVADPADEPAAAAARVALESGALGEDWRFGAEGGDGPAGDLDGALRLVARSGGAAPGSGGLEPFLERAAAGAGTHCLIFAPARPGPWLAPAARAAERRRGRVSFVLACDGVEHATPPPPWWQRALLRPAPRPGVSEQELQAVTAGLAGSGAACAVVDRARGRRFEAVPPARA